MIKLSLIISTYNWPDALELVLRSVQDQEISPFELIIADDGSKTPTKELINAMSTEIDCPVQHVWQEDDGFKLAQIRNKAAAAAKGNYLVFTDGDCLLRPNFVKNHLKIATKGRFVAGNRVLIHESFSKQVLNSKLDIAKWPPSEFTPNQVNRAWALKTFPLGPLRNIKSNSWKQLKGCNFALWKDDFIRINGVDESFIGWGYEDSEMAIRLLRNGIKCTSGRLATTVLHLWHREQDRTNERENWARLQEVLNGEKALAESGVSQYL